jgi:hypothetical protein
LPLKKYILAISLLFGAITSKAQLDVNYKQYAIGFGVSSVLGYTNLNQQQSHFAENVDLTYYYSAYIPITFEVQKGTLSGGSLTLDPSGRVYTNNYLALMLHSDFQLGQITGPDSYLRNFYAGTGFGLMADNDKVQRTKITDPSYTFPGKDQSLNLMVPFRIGYELKFLNSFGEPAVRINVGYVQNLVFGQGLDGYNDPPAHFKHNAIAQYRQILVGIKFDFGSR